LRFARQKSCAKVPIFYDGYKEEKQTQTVDRLAHLGETLLNPPNIVRQ